MRDAENIREVENMITNSLSESVALHSSLFTLHSSLFLIGFIFWPKSSRYVSKKPDYLPTNCKRVGVFVDEDIETIRRIADDYALDYIQLHGHELPNYITQLTSHLSPLTSIKLIKAFNIAIKEDLEATKPYEGLVDYFLFDTKGKSVGGNGEKFDWSVLSAYDGETPYLLSGGIGPDDAERVKAFLTFHLSPLPSNRCVGIDLNSRFELAPGLKDVAALRKFLNELNR